MPSHLVTLFVTKELDYSLLYFDMIKPLSNTHYKKTLKCYRASGSLEKANSHLPHLVLRIVCDVCRKKPIKDTYISINCM